MLPWIFRKSPPWVPPGPIRVLPKRKGFRPGSAGAGPFSGLYPPLGWALHQVAKHFLPPPTDPFFYSKEAPGVRASRGRVLPVPFEQQGVGYA